MIITNLQKEHFQKKQKENKATHSLLNFKVIIIFFFQKPLLFSILIALSTVNYPLFYTMLRTYGSYVQFSDLFLLTVPDLLFLQI